MIIFAKKQTDDGGKIRHRPLGLSLYSIFDEYYLNKNDINNHTTHVVLGLDVRYFYAVSLSKFVNNY